ncbi:TetR/AcrR family transcriptional regulator [Actinomadura madurae]|nr:TetR/AcrR family transcriptional regulator [Actinomadura madurae]MCP9967662.1 TetR/AcrR family transcriptional regulator [Actinomadura madurae]MCP9980112.1 TetR/AcrR family transcriptional regulator [Actinomadura madurae]MCQ0008360.1 TetR/AcrR family transcriptional regulator [Actinomadura madurae]MCQ0016325.1 TetR/AcrR family transcriptional regulator [Actinomadura madurae]
MFTEKGYAAVGIREIAARADMTIGALYHYYPNKEALLIAVTEDALRQAVAMATEAAALDSDPSARLANVVRAHVREQGRAAELWNTSAREMPRTGDDENWRNVHELRADFERVWNEVLQAGVEAGRFQLRDLSVTRLSLLAICNSVSTWYHPDGRLTLDELADLIAAMALDFVRASSEGPAAVGTAV